MPHGQCYYCDREVYLIAAGFWVDLTREDVPEYCPARYADLVETFGPDYPQELAKHYVRKLDENN